MVIINLNLPIGPESENKWLAYWGEEACFFSLDTCKRIFEENAGEEEFQFIINCDGGYVEDGFAIYDYLRTSGKTLHCKIEGVCHSMAVCILLAAPKENRTANQHAMSLIHCVRTEMWGDKTAEELKALAEQTEELQEKILDIYADRTGEDKEVLRQFMQEEKVRDTDFLLEHGFISSIVPYNTNLRNGGLHNINSINQKIMAKKLEEVMAMAQNFLTKAKNALGKALNFDHTDADGNLLFSTDAEDETLEVGMAASPDGTFELPDGRTVIIADGVITEIQQPQTTDENELENLRAENENLRQQLEEAANVITEMQAQLSSNYKPAGAKRNAPQKPAANQATDLAAHKDDQRARLGIKK